jgi:hypothetical protein
VKAIPIVALAALLATQAAGCAFMADVMHAEGEYAHKIGDAFERQGKRREAAKARAAKKVKAATPKDVKPKTARTAED